MPAPLRLESEQPRGPRLRAAAACAGAWGRRGLPAAAVLAPGACDRPPSPTRPKRRGVPALPPGRGPKGRVLLAAVLAAVLAAPTARAEPWPRHTIDASSRGADGVRLADVNGDRLPDVVTGWEEGGVTRLYLNPGPKKVRAPWPAVTVGRTPSVEDAVFADLDRDGSLDVVSCCEGRTRTVFLHRAPREPGRRLDPAAWTTAAIAASKNVQMWMFAVPADIDGRGGLDLVAAGKGRGAAIGWLEAPASTWDPEGWRWHPLEPVGWVMSIRLADLDGDGRRDVLVSDRRGPTRGVFWLRRPGPGADPRRPDAWPRHPVGGADHEVMFLDWADLDGDGRRDILCATRNREILVFRRLPGPGVRWETATIPNPFGVPHGKAVAVGDVDLDGRADLVHTANTEGDRTRPGVAWLKRGPDGAWQAHDISGPRGVKFDLVRLLDLDADGDLDVLACEERDNLGVFWYENPTRRPAR